tara:strand:+ start:21 stop:194 length:174 start_codon:yes stop_codon:yes gene_type:complete
LYEGYTRRVVKITNKYNVVKKIVVSGKSKQNKPIQEIAAYLNIWGRHMPHRMLEIKG